MNIQYSERLQKLPPYLFSELDKKKKELESKGVDIISLGVGDPDLPTPSIIVNAMKEAVAKNENQKYPFGKGLSKFRNSIAKWFSNRFNVELNPESEIYPLIGSKEGIGHLPIAFVNPTEYVLVPDPCYPVYKSSVILAYGKPYVMPLLQENNFYPNFKLIPKEILKNTKIIFLNYPNNPTSQVATKDFFENVINFAKENKIIVAHDCAYSEIYFKDNNDESIPPLSILQIDGAKDVAIEFHSFSKTFNMTGWRVGWVCGNETIINGLAKVKDNYDSGVFNAIQEASCVALENCESIINKNNKIYLERRNILYNGLKELGIDVYLPKATFYVWCKVPKNYTSMSFCEKLLSVGVICTPGSSMGQYGEGYVRFALTVEKEKIKNALDRIKNIL